MKTEKLNDVIEAIYLAAATGSSWQSVVSQLGEIMPGVAFALYGHDFTTNRSLGELYSGFDPAAIKKYNEYYAGVSPWAKGFLASSVNTFLHSDEFIPREELVRTEYYNDWLRPQQQIVGYGSLIAHDKTRFLAFSSTLRECDEIRLEVEMSNLVRVLMPHLQHAFKLTRTLGKIEPSVEVQRLVSLIGDPAILIDSKCRVIFANNAGAALFGSDELLRLKYGSIQFADSTADANLRRQLSSIESRTYNVSGEIFARGPRGRSFSCLVSPLSLASPPQPLQHFVISASAVLLVLKEKQVNFAEFYRLTDGEADVANKLAAGLSLREISQSRGTSLETVRTQLRQTLSKLDVHRQSELVAKVLRSHGSREL